MYKSIHDDLMKPMRFAIALNVATIVGVVVSNEVRSWKCASLLDNILNRRQWCIPNSD